MNGHGQFRVDDIENAYLDGLKLSSAQRARATRAVDAADMRTRIIGCVALLCGENSGGRMRLKARKRFEDLCAELTECDSNCKGEVLFSLLQIPIGELINSRAMRDLAYHALKADRFTVRANAVLVLERLAGQGDAVALHLIESALEDLNEKVRGNAVVALRNIRDNKSD